MLLTRVLRAQDMFQVPSVPGCNCRHRCQRQIGRNIMLSLGEIWAEKILFRLCCVGQRWILMYRKLWERFFFDSPKVFWPRQGAVDQINCSRKQRIVYWNKRTRKVFSRAIRIRFALLTTFFCIPHAGGNYQSTYHLKRFVKDDWGLINNCWAEQRLERHEIVFL